MVTTLSIELACSQVAGLEVRGKVVSETLPAKKYSKLMHEAYTDLNLYRYSWKRMMCVYIFTVVQDVESKKKVE